MGVDTQGAGADVVDTALLAQRIDTAIDKSGLSGAEVARRTGLGQHVISRYRRGHGVPGLENLARIARVIKVSIDSLVAPRQRRPRARAA